MSALTDVQSCFTQFPGDRNSLLCLLKGLLYILCSCVSGCGNSLYFPSQLDSQFLFLLCNNAGFLLVLQTIHLHPMDPLRDALSPSVPCRRTETRRSVHSAHGMSLDKQTRLLSVAATAYLECFLVKSI